MVFDKFMKKKQVNTYIKELESIATNEYGKIFHIAYSYTHDKEEALDLIQDSFQKALNNLNGRKKIENVSLWFYKILVFTAVDKWRKQKRAPSIIQFDEQISLFSFTDDKAFSKIDIHSILKQLSSPAREIIILKFFEGFTLKDIANILDMNENTVKTKMYRSLNELRKALE
ncbi:RNA polymerase sigma factor [Enterococcus sp. 5H]|uniref:RNA polymerase sigma factor n=1 Tax=Enterococcus sp. 5H TaxID=1229490 RepID=UPI003FA539FC